MPASSQNAAASPPRKPHGKLSGPAFKVAERRIAEAAESSATELDLSINGLTRIPSLSRLQTLQSLHLNGTQVADLHPLADLSALQSLSLIDSRVTNLAPLARLPTLKTLELAHAKITDLSPLAMVRALETLNLFGCPVADISPLANLPFLREVGISYTLVKDLSPLTALSSLQSLRAASTRVDDLAPLAGLSALETLGIQLTQVTDLTPLTALTTLKSLRLARTPITDLTPLANLAALNLLDASRIRNPNLTPIKNLFDLTFLDLSYTQISNLAPLANLSALESLNLKKTVVTDISPLSRLSALQYLDLSYTRVANLTPLAKLIHLQTLNISYTRASDLVPLVRLSSLKSLNLRRTPIVDLAPVSSLSAIEYLDLSHTFVIDLSPITGLPNLVRAKSPNTPRQTRYRQGISFSGCPITDEPLLSFAKLENPERTVKTIAYLRDQISPAPSDPNDDSEPTEIGASAPLPLEGLPAPFDFALTSRKTISAQSSSANWPMFPYKGSEERHAQRLEACHTIANDIVSDLSQHRHNVRNTYKNELERYCSRLPTTPGTGNILLADAVARILRSLFAAEASILPYPFAAQLKTFLEQHMALRVFYPELPELYRDVQEGRISSALPQDAVDGFIHGIDQHTPDIFEPSVSEALDGTTESVEVPEIDIVDSVALEPNQPLPPPDPLGEVEPRRARDFTIASTINRLWKAILDGETLSKGVSGWINAVKTLTPYAREILDWLHSFHE